MGGFCINNVKIGGTIIMTLIFAATMGPFGYANGQSGEPDEKNVSLSEVPPAVRATIEKYASSATVKEIEIEYKNGRAVYEVEIISNGCEKEFKVGADGKFLGFNGEDKDKDDNEGREG